MKQVNLYDFQGGYATNIPSPMMRPNELLQAENCHWNNGLVKRKGYQKYSTNDATFDAGTVVGMIRTDISGTYETVAALNTPSVGLTLWHGEATMQSMGISLNESADVRFVQMGTYLIGVTGADWPFVIQHDGTDYTFQTIENLDTRTRQWFEWHIVGLDNDNPPVGTEYTEDVQGADVPIVLTSGLAGESIVVSCDFTFNKITFNGVIAPVMTDVTYEYSRGTGWQEFTPHTTPDWLTDGDHVLEFNLPLINGGLHWTPFYGAISGVTERYAVRITFNQAHTSVGITEVIPQMNQYLRLVMAGEYGTDVVVHNSRLQIASGNVAHFSPVNKITDWRSDEVEYFQDGGTVIQRMVSFPQALVVLKEDAVYALTGNSYQNYRKQLISRDGTIAPRSVVNMGQEIYYLARDGIRGWNGTQSVVLSKHITTDVPVDDEAVGMSYDRNYWIAFPSTNTILRFDPDTAFRRKNGDASVGFFKYTNMPVHMMVWGYGNRDTGHVYAAVTNAGGIFQLDVGETDNGVAIEMSAKTLYFTFSQPGTRKRIGRIKPEVIPSGEYTLRFEADDGQQSIDITLFSGSEGYSYSEDITLPHTLDGKNLAMKFTHTGGPAGIRAIHVEHDRRVY